MCRSSVLLPQYHTGGGYIDGSEICMQLNKSLNVSFNNQCTSAMHSNRNILLHLTCNLQGFQHFPYLYLLQNNKNTNCKLFRIQNEEGKEKFSFNRVSHFYTQKFQSENSSNWHFCVDILRKVEFNQYLLVFSTFSNYQKQNNESINPHGSLKKTFNHSQFVLPSTVGNVYGVAVNQRLSQ